MQDRFDAMAAVVDWLDAAKNRDLEALLDLFAADARLECACERIAIAGRSALAAYWQPKLLSLSPTAFDLDELRPSTEGVIVDYLSFEDKPVRIEFAFDAEGKISQARCKPLSL